MQRHSSGRDSGHLTDSGIACCNDDSHIYSEPTTEDPAAYLDPVRIRLDPDEELYWPGGDASLMEGSVADTDYLDNFGRRCTTTGDSPGGGSGGVKAINVDKYKIRPPPPSFPPPRVPTSEPTKEVESCQKLAADEDRAPENEDMYSSDESLVRRKLLALGEGEEVPSSLQSSASTLMMNNLNKCSSDRSLARDDSCLSAPNIFPSPPPPPLPAARPLGLVNRAVASSLQHSLPTLSTQHATHVADQAPPPRRSSISSSVDARLDSLSPSHSPAGKHHPIM